MALIALSDGRGPFFLPVPHIRHKDQCMTTLRVLTLAFLWCHMSKYISVVLCLQWSWWGWPGTRFSFTFEFYLWLHKRIISTHGFSLSLAKMCIPVHHGQGGPVSEIASLPLSEEPSPGPFNFQSRCERGFTDIALICETWGLCPHYSVLPWEGDGSHRQCVDE